VEAIGSYERPPFGNELGVVLPVMMVAQQKLKELGRRELQFLKVVGHLPLHHADLSLSRATVATIMRREWFGRCHPKILIRVCDVTDTTMITVMSSA
jgi:hypothetical protein